MIIDVHGHHTSTPPGHDSFRRAQLAHENDPSRPTPLPATISDDEIRERIETNQLAAMAERGIDLMIMSPKASAMEHHRPDPRLALGWARAANDLVHRVTTLYPGRFAGVAQLPQVLGGSLDGCIRELQRAVLELGFVGCNVNPDPSGGAWDSPPMTDRYWFPLYEAMIELDVPAMIHVSSSCRPSVHTLGAHYLNGDTTVFMQLVEGNLFEMFPDLRLVIPHGGGAVPYHWGRFQGLAERLGRPSPLDSVMTNVWFDTCVYSQPGIRLLLDTVRSDRILFATEMLGAVPNAVDPITGRFWDDTKSSIEALGLDSSTAELVFEKNARMVYPRLSAVIGSAAA